MSPTFALASGTFANGAMLTRGVPGVEPRVFEQWLGSRWAWWPHGVPAGHRVGLASSRLGRRLETQQAWFNVLRAACAKVNSQDGLLVSTVSTTSARFVERAAELFGIRLLRVEVADDGVDLATWWSAMQEVQTPATRTNVYSVFLSPCLDAQTLEPEAMSNFAGCELKGTPARDRALIALSDQLLVSHVRPNGHLHLLLRTRLQEGHWPLASVQVAIGKELLSEPLRDELMASGAVGWYLMDAELGEPRADVLNEAAQPKATRPVLENAPVISMGQLPAWSYLAHCTRQRVGAWPDESEAEFLDSLLLAAENNDRSPLAALRRILKQQRILATSDANRGGHQVVSFTEVLLAELKSLRTFRPHRGRWDFEPYGIGIRRSWLESAGCRPVHYGDEALWEQLSENDRPFFQRATSGRSGKPFDWTVEKEWRHLGNVDLADVPADSAFVFVPSCEEAEQVAMVSRWPVVVLDPTK